MTPPRPTAAPARRPARRARTWALGALAGATLVALPVAAVRVLDGGSSPVARASPPPPLPAVVSEGGMAARSGVRVVRVAATGGGGLLDLRYQVVDADAAAAVHDARTPPALVDERTGLVLGRLLMDHVHHGRPKAGVTYVLLFLDPGDAIRQGDRVSVVLGGARLAHVVVR